MAGLIVTVPVPVGLMLTLAEAGDKLTVLVAVINDDEIPSTKETIPVEFETLIGLSANVPELYLFKVKILVDVKFSSDQIFTPLF